MEKVGSERTSSFYTDLIHAYPVSMLKLRSKVRTTSSENTR
ncbi:unnamed protein product [Brassica oleracea]